MKYLITFLLFTFLGTNTLSAQCIDCDKQVFLGIYSNSISKKKAQKLNFDNEEGSYVTGVIGNTAAEKAGLQPFDYVYGIDEYRTNIDRPLTGILRKYEPGEEVTVHFYRKGKRKKATVKLGKRSDARYNKRSKKEDPFLGVEESGKDVENKIKGVRVNIVDNSTASSIGLEDSDIITHINGFPILDWQDMEAAIDMMEVGGTIKVDYIRNDKKSTTNGTIKSLAETKYKSHSYQYDGEKEEENDFSINFNNNSDRIWDERFDVRKRNIDGINVRMEEVTSIESEGLKEKYEIELPLNNNLPIEALNLAPNLNKGIFELTFNLPNKGNTIINIYNSQGRNIYTYDLGTYSGAFEDSIDISQNGTGIYFLSIEQDNKNIAKKVVLSK